MEFKKAAVDIEIEQEELQNEHSHNETLASDISVLPLELGSHASPAPVGLPSNVFLPVDPLFDAQNVTSEALKVDHEMSSASVISQDGILSQYVSLPTPASQRKDTKQGISSKADANDITLSVNMPGATSSPTATKEQTFPTKRCKSEQLTPQQDVLSTPQSSPQPSHTQLEQVLLQTLQHLTQQSVSQVPPPQSAKQAIADALKQVPTLPNIELMKFGGDPSEYGEFVANFCDNFESQVSDDSRRLTHLLAQCVGKARDAIKSCVNLPVGQRYNAAWKTLLKNFGQPHMVADAHMRKLTEYNLRRVNATNLMDFARRLEDTKWVLTSMGPLYVSRLDNEDTILKLMKKLPNEGLKRKWTDIAGDTICSKGHVDFYDFLNFIQKRADHLNNRFGQESKSSPLQQEKEKRYGNRGKQDPPINATTLTTQSKGSRKPTDTRSATLKCYQCSGPHAIWHCEVFRNLSHEDRLRTIEQKKLCGSCLGHGHFSRSCPKGYSCRKPRCGRKHHSLLHPHESRGTIGPEAKQDSAKQQTIIQDQSSVGRTASTVTQSNPSSVNESSTFAVSRDSIPVEPTASNRPRVCFKVVPVRVSGPGSNKQLATYAFLDSGSDTTLCLRSLLEELSLKANPLISPFQRSIMKERNMAIEPA